MYRCLVVTCFLFFVLIAKTWSQESITAQVFAEVVEGLAAKENQSLNFGRFIVGSDRGAIIISPKGERVANGGIIVESGDYSPGQFVVEGDLGANFIIHLPNEKTILTNGKSGETMQVGDWVSDPPLDIVATLRGGSRMISIGATLNIGTIDENPAGIYAGSFVLTFAYY